MVRQPVHILRDRKYLTFSVLVVYTSSQAVYGGDKCLPEAFVDPAVRLVPFYRPLVYSHFQCF